MKQDYQFSWISSQGKTRNSFFFLLQSMEEFRKSFNFFTGWTCPANTWILLCDIPPWCFKGRTDYNGVSLSSFPRKYEEQISWGKEDAFLSIGTSCSLCRTRWPNPAHRNPLWGCGSPSALAWGRLQGAWRRFNGSTLRRPRRAGGQRVGQ